MEIPVELAQIIINETADEQVVVLRELQGVHRTFPIVIGMAEILAIDRRVKGLQLPRPLTHDLLVSTITQMGGVIQKVVICDLREHTFFAAIHVTRDGRELVIDSRPSDALAMTAGMGVPLFVEDHVFEQMKM